jgi:Trk-type K+ transport system membrane component
MAQGFVYNFTRLATTTAGTSISTGTILLSAVVFNTSGSSANKLSIHNATSTGAGTVAIVNSASTGTASFTVTYNVMCPNGLFVSNTGGVSGDVTVLWS